MDLRQLQQFVTVAETLNFRKAAERLNVAQPAISVALRRLEHELGVRLFDRGRQGVKLTEAGAAALPDAQETLNHAARLKRQAVAAAGGMLGVARLGFVGTAAYEVLPRALIAIRTRFPEISVELQEGTTSELLQGLARDEFDLGIIRYPAAVPDGFLLEAFEADRLGVVMPLDHPRAQKSELSLSELKHEAFILPSASRTPDLFNAHMARFQAAGFRPRIVHGSSDVQAVIALVEAGLGVALMAELFGREGSGRISFCPLTADAAAFPTGLGLLFHPGRLSRTAGHLRDLLLEVTTRSRGPDVRRPTDIEERTGTA